MHRCPQHPPTAGATDAPATYGPVMRGETRSSLDRYLRVAYDAEGAVERGHSAAPRAPGRWAVRPAVAVRVAAVVLVLAVAAITFLLLSAGPETPAAPLAEPVVAPSPTGAEQAETSAGEPTTENAVAVVVVHVAGAVERPGVVELDPGTRVDEAITAAGGATEKADLDALNLAAPVVDGQQVYVPEQGEAAPPSVVAGGAASGGSSTGTLVDLNTADAAGLDTLPGIGPALAQRIIDWRTEHGPFASVESLTDVSGIGPATMEKLRDLVTV